MIRKLVAKAWETLGRPEVTAVLAVAAVTTGVGILQWLASESQEELARLERVIASRTAQLQAIKTEIGRAMNAEEAAPAPEPYPSREDVDPLHRGEQEALAGG